MHTMKIWLSSGKRRRGRIKSSSTSSFSGFSSPSTVLTPLLSTITSSFDNAFTSINASSNVCTTTYVMTSLVMLAKPDASHKPISDTLYNLSRKRNGELSGSLSSFSHD